MAQKISMRQKRQEAPDWIFPWKGRREPILPKLLAVVLAALFTAGLFGFVRIQRAAPSWWGLEKASVIQVIDTVEGRALALRARENGPSPVRFESSDWPQLVRFQDQQMMRLSQPQSAYEPRLRPWQDPPPEEPSLWESNAGVLPLPPKPQPMPAVPAAGAPHPSVQPISGLGADEVPAALPRYEGVMDKAMLSGSVRFLIRLDQDGRVADCLALSGADTADATAELAGWLRNVRFLREGGPGSWAAVAIVFLNQAP